MHKLQEYIDAINILRTTTFVTKCYLQYSHELIYKVLNDSSYISAKLENI